MSTEPTSAADDAAVLAILARMEVQAWRPIDERPSDDREVLVYSPLTGCYYLAHCAETGTWMDDLEALSVGRNWRWRCLPAPPLPCKPAGKRALEGGR